MSGGWEIDGAEVKQLELDLSAAPARMQRQGPAAVAKVSRWMRGEMRKDARGHNFLPHFATRLSDEAVGWEAELGFDRVGQGKLARIIVEGSVNNAPVYDVMAGVRRTMPRVEREFGDVVELSVLGER